jgi:hypothetical protein
MFVVACKKCRRDVPTGVGEFPFELIVVECPLCGEKRRYLPTEVFLGRVDRLVNIRKRAGGNLMFDPDAHMPRINRRMVCLGACLIAEIRLAPERQVNVRVVPPDRRSRSLWIWRTRYSIVCFAKCLNRRRRFIEGCGSFTYEVRA